MVGNIGLGKFNPIELKEAKSSFAPKSNKSDSIPSNDSSTVQTKTLEKSENKQTKKLEKNYDNKKLDSNAENKSESKTEFDKKIENLVKSQEKTQGKASGVDTSKLSKKEIEQLEKEISQKSAQNLEIPQMMMLQGVQPVFVNQQAAPVVAAENKVELNLEAKVSAQTQPVLKFMKAMQENFGISPEQIMKALGQMPPEALMESPNKAMTPLFEKLGLQPKQFTKAQILYTEMLTEMEQVKPELFKGNVAAAGAAPAFSQMSQANATELPMQVLEKPMLAPKSTLDQLIEQKISRRALEPSNMQGLTSQAKIPQVNIGQIFNVEPKAIDPMASGMTNDQFIAVDKLGEFDPQLRIQDVKINPNRISEQFLAESVPTIGAGAVAATAFAENASQKEMSDDELKDQLADPMSQMMSDKKLDGQFALDKLAPTSAAGVAVKPGELSNENVEKILSSSKSLIQKGGGEMKIQLSPEGLGKVHLDIKVKDGQVGIQMMADTQEAKKLLESSMNDLKMNLAEHKLNLNSVKVDVSEQASQNMNQSQDFKREEARDFLGQFRQFNESFRQNGNDHLGARAYKQGNPKTPDIQPIQTKNTKSSDGGRLHLVA